MGMKKVILLVLLAAAAYFAYTKLNPPPVETVVKETPEVQKPTEPTEPTSPEDWFTSTTLGIKFIEPFDTPETTKVIGNRIYVDRKENADPTDVFSGQFVEVLSKQKNLSLTETLTQTILKDYSPNDCQVTVLPNPSFKSREIYKNFEYATVDVVGDYSDPSELEILREKCPAIYTQSNGLAYFMYDPEVPDKYAFVAVGQYLLQSQVVAEGKTYPWNETIEFIK